MQKGFVIILILAIIIGIFAISNSAVVTIDFIFTKVLLSQAIVIFICALLGALIATIFGLIRQMSLKKEIKELANKNKKIQIEVDQLKLEVDDLTRQLNEKEEEINLLNSTNNNQIYHTNESVNNGEVFDTDALINKDEDPNESNTDDNSYY